MESLVIFVHVIAAIGITGLVLMQHGKGADMGASFGSGASQTIFGSSGSGNALTKSTAWLATIFFVTSLALALFAKQQAGTSIQDEDLIQNASVLDEMPVVQDIPAAESVTSDIPQSETTEQASADPALQQAAEQVAAEAAAEQDEAAPAATSPAEDAAVDAEAVEQPAEEAAQ